MLSSHFRSLHLSLQPHVAQYGVGIGSTGLLATEHAFIGEAQDVGIRQLRPEQLYD